MKNLDQVLPACLGLTCKAFYPFHKELRGIVPLYSWYYLALYAMLGERLETWAGTNLARESFGGFPLLISRERNR
jgi:hypothetical protein